MSVSDAEGGQVLACCHAGCGQREVIAALKQLGIELGSRGDLGILVLNSGRLRIGSQSSPREPAIQFHGDLVDDIGRASKTEVKPDPRPFFDDDINDVGRGP